MTTPMLVTDAKGQTKVKVPRLLHPGIWFAMVWTTVLSLWAGLPEDTFRAITGSDRYVTLNSALYLTLALVAFLIGTFMGPGLFKVRIPAVKRADPGAERTIPLLRRGTLIALSVGGAAFALIVVQGVIKAGGPGSFADELLSGVPWSDLSSRYFTSSRIQGVTVWVQINSAVAALATLGLLIEAGKGATSRFFRYSLLAGFIIALLQGFLLSDRLTTYEYLVVAGTVWVGLRTYRGEPVLTPRVLVRVGILLAVGVAVWFSAEFGRSYLPRYGPSVTSGDKVDSLAVDDEDLEAPSVSSVAGNQFLAYILTGPNNGLYAVDHFRNHTIVYRSAKALFTTTGQDNSSAPFVGAGIAEASSLLREIYAVPRFTVYSFPGYAFMDLSWGGIVLTFWFGMLVGAVYYRFAVGEFWALLIYPFFFVGVLDSWRILYWSESRMLVPVLLIAIVSYAVYADGRKVTKLADIGRSRETGVVDGA